MNKRGISIIVTIMIAVTIIILGLALAPVLDQNNLGIRGDNNTLVNGNVHGTDVGRAPGLNCGADNTTAGDYIAGACIISDLFTPTFLAVLLGIAGLVVGAKVVFSK